MKTSEQWENACIIMVIFCVRGYVTTCRQDDESITKSNLYEKKTTL